MRFWLLEQVGHGGWDENEGFVVRARSEEEARSIADAEAADEGPIWSDPLQTTCIEATSDGEPGVVLRAFRPG